MGLPGTCQRVPERRIDPEPVLFGVPRPPTGCISKMFSEPDVLIGYVLSDPGLGLGLILRRAVPKHLKYFVTLQGGRRPHKLFGETLTYPTEPFNYSVASYLADYSANLFPVFRQDRIFKSFRSGISGLFQFGDEPQQRLLLLYRNHAVAQGPAPLFPKLFELIFLIFSGVNY